MPTLYGRRIEVEIAGLKIEDLRIAFSVSRNMDPTQDKGAVTIFNLTPERSARIRERGRDIIVRAGYPETVAIVFEGRVQRVRAGREDLAWIDRLELGDMVRSRSTLSGTFNRVYEGQVSSRTIAVDIISEGLGLLAGPLTNIPESATFRNFYWPGGPAVGALESLLRPLGLTWFEQDGVVRVNAPGRLQNDAPAIVKTPETGLIELAQPTDEGFEARMFLDARVVLGSRLRIEQRGERSEWKVVGIQHTGDNWDGGFETFCDLRALS